MKCSGSGIVPMCVIKNKVHIITFMDKDKNASDAGGKIDAGHTNNDTIIKYVAMKELFEESSGLIKLDNLDESVYFDLKNKNSDTYYRLYFVIINKINFAYYNKNLEKFNKYKLNPYNEMYAIKILNMDTVKFNDKNIVVKTLDNKNINIAYRLKFVLYMIYRKFTTFKDFFNALDIKKIILKKNIIPIMTREYISEKHIYIENIISYQT